MSSHDAWKTLSPEEQMLQLVRDVAKLKRDMRLYTRLQGIRLESRDVGGQRRLYAVITDVNASNYPGEYQLAP